MALDDKEFATLKSVLENDEERIILYRLTTEALEDVYRELQHEMQTPDVVFLSTRIRSELVYRQRAE